MRHVKQPPLSKVCGQACMAMILNTGLLDAVRLCRHGHATRTADIVRVVTKNSNLSPVHDRLLSGRKLTAMTGCEGLWLCKVVPHNRKAAGPSHWVLWKNKRWFDPAAEASSKTLDPLYRVTSRMKFVEPI